MKLYSTIILAIASVLMIAISAHAETNYRFEIYGAAYIPVHKDFEIGPPQFMGSLPGAQKFRTGARGGIRVGVDGLGHWGQDITYSYGMNDSRIVIFQNGEFDFTSRSHQFAYNVLLYPGGAVKKLCPFVTAGAGGTIFTVSNLTASHGLFAGLGEMKPHTSFTFNVGGGFRYQFNKTYGIRFDIRDWMSHPPRHGIPEKSASPSEMALPISGVFHQPEASIAFVIHFKTK